MCRLFGFKQSSACKNFCCHSSKNCKPWTWTIFSKLVNSIHVIFGLFFCSNSLYHPDEWRNLDRVIYNWCNHQHLLFIVRTKAVNNVHVIILPCFYSSRKGVNVFNSMKCDIQNNVWKCRCNCIRNVSIKWNSLKIEHAIKTNSKRWKTMQSLNININCWICFTKFVLWFESYVTFNLPINFKKEKNCSHYGVNVW